MSYKGVDVSFWKEMPDWYEARDHVSFAIIGITERNGIDASFEHNYQQCRATGVKLGAYKYSYARSGAESKAEAEKIVTVLDGRPLDYPIFLDLEWDVQAHYTKYYLNQIIEEFRAVVENAGYKFGIYCNKYWYDNIIPEEAKKYDFWIASIPYNDDGTIVESLKPDYPNLVGWQYSWNGRVPGIDGFVDMDLFFIEPASSESTKPEKHELKKPDVSYPMLSYGSTGEWVELLQIKLNQVGEDLLVDGVFGVKTQESVITYQMHKELDPDGIVGPETWDALNTDTEKDKTTLELAQEIICGIWGNQPERKKLLKAAGYKNYKEIQNMVNELMG